jgi:hypothetical protein
LVSKQKLMRKSVGKCIKMDIEIAGNIWILGLNVEIGLTCWVFGVPLYALKLQNCNEKPLK